MYKPYFFKRAKRNDMTFMKFVTCNNCGWVHMGVSADFAKAEVEKFNQYWELMTPESREMYGNHKASLETYLECGTCGNPYKNFRESVEGDCPSGCTIGPILHFNFEMD